MSVENVKLCEDEIWVLVNSIVERGFHHEDIALALEHVASIVRGYQHTLPEEEKK